MTKNWDKPRKELAEIGAGLCRLGYPLRHIARNMADQHYYGISRHLAAKKLQPLIIKAWYKLNGGMTEEQEQRHHMASELRGGAGGAPARPPNMLPVYL